MTATYNQPRRRMGCLFFFILLVAGFVGLCYLPAPAEDSLFSSWFSTPAQEAGVDAYPALTETWSDGSGSNKVIRIPLTGLIMFGENQGFFSPAGSTDMALQAIRRATYDPEVRAIIMEIDSGGGGITASDILYNALLNFRAADTTRQVITLCGDMAASGAYYIALASDHIIAHPTTVTGSIGVIIQGLNFRELAQRHGVADMTFKSGANKDLLNPLGESSAAQQAIVQNVVDDMHKRFVSLVATRRKIPETALVPLTDGRIFTASHALELELIDEIGYWEDAVNRTATLLGVPDICVYRYDESVSLMSLLQVTSRLNPRTWFGETARLQYRLNL